MTAEGSHAVQAGGAGAEGHTHDPVHTMSQHVLTRLGIQVVDEDLLRFDLRLAPAHFDIGGHINFGVLGTYLDMACSQPPDMQLGRPFVHSDITVHRLARPRGDVLKASARSARMGRRSGVIEIEVHDDRGVHVARSIQEVVFPTNATPRPQVDGDGIRERFYAQFHSECTLDAPFEAFLGITGPHGGDGPPVWEIPLSDITRNGFGGLHGGVTTALIDAAAVGVVRAQTGGQPHTVSAAVRYLKPALAGPISATPRLVSGGGEIAVVVVDVCDADGGLTTLADVHVAVV